MELQEISELFQLGLKEFGEIPHAFTLQQYGPNEVVFREGESPDMFYFIRSGQVLVSKRNQSGDDEPLSVLKEGQFFGEIGLLENMQRTATVKALGDLEVFQLDSERFENLLKRSDAFASLLHRIGRNRLLTQTPLFRALDDHSLMSIQELLIEKTYPDNTVVFHENDPSDALYIILKGGVRLSKHAKLGRDVTLTYLGEADFFGEMGLIETKPRSATVVTTEASKLLVLPGEDFQSLLRQDPLISFNMLKVLSQRLGEEDKEIALAKGTTFFKGMTIVTRPERCLSCKACEIACAVSKSRTHTLHDAILEEPAPVKRIYVRKTLAGSEPIIRPEHCSQCRDAPCLASCKFGAMKRDLASGTIVILEENCKGCALCAKACPFKVIAVIRSKEKKRVALKCTYCAEHQAGPACVRSCPTNALVISLSTMAV